MTGRSEQSSSLSFSSSFPTLTQLCFLHEDLREGPADPAGEGGQQHQDEALQVELGRFKRKHEEAARDQQDHQDQERVLLRAGREETGVIGEKYGQKKKEMGDKNKEQRVSASLMLLVQSAEQTLLPPQVTLMMLMITFL